MRTRPVALITGGTRGIGYGIALVLAREGWDLLLNGRRPPEEVTAALDGLAALGARVAYAEADIARAGHHDRLLERARMEFGRLDLLVNNAGIAPRVRADILEAGEDSFDEVLETNLKGPYFLTQRAARWMAAQREADRGCRRCIVFVTSISAEVASVNRGEYCVAKAGLSMAARLWAVRLAEHDIAVYEVRPGIVRTDMTAGVQERYDRLIEGGLLLQPRWGTPEDVGRAVAMLARGDLAYSTGAVIEVSGGMGVPRL
ncbi:MAG: 3-ketoacyl-ACP reductase [Chthonomonadales bacterium]|nr:3-ketoacyl-ACP reductase [Chthonomonadales bacterium]